MEPTEEHTQWEIAKTLLPEGWEEWARATGAFQRARGVPDEETLLRLLLLHGAKGLSLIDTVAQARLAGWCEISAVSLHDRLKTSEPWLRRICKELLAEGLAGEADQAGLDSRWRWRAIDGSDIREPGPTGSTWRLHFSLSLPSLECDCFELTSQKQGETLRYWNFAPGEVILADRGYSHPSGAARVVDAGAHFLLRLEPRRFTLWTKAGRKFNLVRWLRRAGRAHAFEREVTFRHGGKSYSARLCAIAKSDAAAERSARQVRDKARRHGSTPSAQALALARYTLVLTTLPQEEFPTARILNIYRCRWQVELAFKRLKSLLKLGHLPKRHPQSSQAWLLAKLLAALLIQKTLRQAQLFSPWGYPLPQTKLLAPL